MWVLRLDQTKRGFRFFSYYEEHKIISTACVEWKTGLHPRKTKELNEILGTKEWT